MLVEATLGNRAHRVRIIRLWHWPLTIQEYNIFPAGYRAHVVCDNLAVRHATLLCVAHTEQRCQALACCRSLYRAWAQAIAATGHEHYCRHHPAALSARTLAAAPIIQIQSHAPVVS